MSTNGHLSAEALLDHLLENARVSLSLHRVMIKTVEKIAADWPDHPAGELAQTALRAAEETLSYRESISP